VTVFPGLEGRESGQIALGGNRLVFTREGGRIIEIPYSRLQIRIGGQNTQHFFFTDRLQPGVEVCGQNRRILESLAASGVSEAREMLARAKRKHTLEFALRSIPFVLALLLLLAIPMAIHYTPSSWLGSLVSHEHERIIGRVLMPIVSSRPAGPATTEKHLQKIVAHFVRHNPGLEKLDLQIHLSDSDEVNAFALPGGLLVVNSELLKEAESVEEVMGVVGHEIAHVELRHVLKSTLKGFGSLAGFALVSFIVNPDFALVLLKATEFLELKYSREDELAADRRGGELLANAGISTGGLIAFFTRLGNERGGVEQALSILRTHPASADRVASLQQLATEPRVNATPPVTLDDLHEGL
jgi:Zn-dependent protease with chaperone function